MIASIDYQADIDIYLDPEEIKEIKNQTIEGVLIKISDPRRQGLISISFNEERRNEGRGMGIGVCDKNYWGVQESFRIDTFIGDRTYQKILKEGKIGLRQGMKDGSKISIEDKSKMSSLDLLQVKNLEFYRDNKDKLEKLF